MKWSNSCPKLQRNSCLLFRSIQVQLMYLNPWNCEIWKPFFHFSGLQVPTCYLVLVLWKSFSWKNLGLPSSCKEMFFIKNLCPWGDNFCLKLIFLFFSLGDRGKHKPGYIHQFCWHWCNGEPAIDFHRHWEQNSDDRLLGRAFFVNKLKFQKLQKRLAGSHIWK